MKTRWMISLIALGAFIFLPQPALADDLADLKATNMRLDKAWNTGDMKTAFVFPGQGAQVVGMGKDIADAFSEAADIFAVANDIVGFDLRVICFEGPADKLNTTTISQPAIFTTSAAILEAIRTNTATGSITADITAGMSLGEYTALYAAGAISFADCLRLVHIRGRSMQQAAEQHPGAMVSILGLDESQVNQLCTGVLSELKASRNSGGTIHARKNENGNERS